MICKYCNFEMDNQSKYCPECGKRVEVETILPKEDSVQLENTFVEEDVIKLTTEETVENTEDEGRKIWYYVSAGDTVGGFTEGQMLDLVKNGTITKNTYVWREGDSDWRFACNSMLGSFFETPEEQVYIESDKKEENKEWYYADDGNNQHGPYSEMEMVRFIQDGVISNNNYVWKPGLNEWIFLKESSLSGYSKQQAQTYDRSRTIHRQTQTQSNSFGTVSVLQSRSIALAVILCFVTCGLYSLYWLYAVVKETNSIAASQGKAPVFDAGLAVLLSFCTCGLFSFYLYWKLGKSLGSCKNKHGNQMEDTSIVMMLLAIFGLSIVSKCIAQSQINECAN